jgi:hypothetical protein
VGEAADTVLTADALFVELAVCDGVLEEELDEQGLAV